LNLRVVPSFPKKLFAAWTRAPVLARDGLPSPPKQPLGGPGGADYPHAGVARRGPFWPAGRERNNAFRYFIYEPTDPVLAQAPVVLFLHGWQAYRPDIYGAWMEHVARKGYVVVWVQYDHNVIGVWRWATNAMITWMDALSWLERRAPQSGVKPERDSAGHIKTAIVGHSVGAYLAVILAAKAACCRMDLPIPSTLVSIQPARRRWIPGADPSRIDARTKIVLVVGDADYVSRFDTAVAIWKGIGHIPAENKVFLLVQSDDRGVPPQIANHYFPNCDGYLDTAAVDARDYYVTFKLTVAALNCAFKSKDCEYAFRAGAEQVDMGRWSDGVPVMPLINVDPAMQTVPPLRRRR